MLNLKKTAVAVLAFGSSAVFAGTMGPVCAPGNVTVPCEKSAWDFGVQALYLQPSLSSHSFIGTRAGANGTLDYLRANPNYAWGFKLEGSYHYGQGNDVDLNWYHVSKTRNATIYPDVDLLTRDVVEPIRTTVKPQWDAVNLEFGQHVDFTESTSARFHAGLAYVRVENQRNGYLLTTTADRYNTTMKYNGVGPRLGMDNMYDWGNGFGIYGNAAMALFTGQSKFNSAAYDAAGQVLGSNGSTTSVVPELEAKLGAKYTYAMAQGDLSLDIGWMWVNYFHGQQFGTPLVADVKDTDFGLQGPYVGLKWVGNVA